MIVYEEDLDDFIAHYGVKGMKWGRTKKFAKAVGTVAVVAGAGAAVVVLAKNGKLPISSIPNYAQKAMKGKAIMDQFKRDMPPRKVSDIPKAPKPGSPADHAAYKKNVSRVLADMKDANKDQDQWMRGLGLGAAVNQANAKERGSK